ncbi:type VI secretion system secreted protein VgrG [Paraburkholderia eburnea]|uniref:Type VI secretion system secreted protein VgrG n=1 Tax=Paraburkholderia eburnea TaxID=1189126 RepID=A0A2S4MFS0_9BURK|nr:type VI secretion system tip protein VgrG [Paraburkholderia eburnea]POR53590.1 type VI secretion system secreted protein VgrG [Paraburkholderia eburnea]PRZ25558.1 type VI secretion system secreted protein VgrG [Paraburkholderia eburnea]
MASLFDDARSVVPDLKAIPGRQAYHLDVPGTDSSAEVSVVSYTAKEKMGAANEVVIVFTHPRRLGRDGYLNQEATFSIVADDGAVKKYSGHISRFSAVKTTGDFTKHEIVLRSGLARLEGVVMTAIYQHKSTPQIIEAILRRHGMKGHQFVFRLRSQYPLHLFRMQYRMSDMDYVHMLMERDGIYCFVVETEHGDQTVFADDVDHYLYDPRLTVPYREAAGLESGGVEAVTMLRTHAEVVPQSYVVADYNPEKAWERFRDSANVAPQDQTTYGQPYIYGTHHLDQAGAKRQAQIRHEAAIAWQVIYEGESTVLELQPGRVLEMDAELPDAPDGLVVIEVTHSGARDQSYSNTFKAIPADRRFRLQFEESKWARISGTLSARVTSPDRYKYGYLTVAGYYTVRFDVDFADWPRGGESVPLRLAKPFAGKLQTGMHFVALDNDEAVIAFRDGDPDKPEIIAFHHHSQATDLVTSDRRWLSRNMIRTQANNKLRMEDWAGQEGVKLSTEHSGKSQLSLGYLVNQKLEYRGEGFELRTSGYGAIRSGKGLLVTTLDRPNAQGNQTDMQELMQQLQASHTLMERLAQCAQQAQAQAADVKAMNEVLQSQIKDLQQAVMVLSSASSIAVATPESILHGAGKNLTFVAGQNADVGVQGKVTMTAGELISLFAEEKGIELVASHGKVNMQAQNDAMALCALHDLTITSVDGRLVLSAAKEVWIGADGSYIKINGSSIENVTSGDILEKCAMWDKLGAASGKVASSLPQGDAVVCSLRGEQANSQHAALMGGA